MGKANRLKGIKEGGQGASPLDWGPWMKGRLPEEIADLKTESGERRAESWVNSAYQVIIWRETNTPDQHSAGRHWPKMVWLSIKRHDKGPMHDWRHLQWIKNDLVGEECEGVELFPAESRLVDQANQYHLWVVEKPGERFPFGYEEREVALGDHVHVKTGDKSRQRLFPKDRMPEPTDIWGDTRPAGSEDDSMIEEVKEEK